MRGLFIIGTIAVLVCSIWVSFNHTLELFMEGGYKNGLEWGITIAAETAFLMGVLSRFNSRLRGTKPHAPATFLFLLGLGVVGWSNWNAGAAYGWQGILKGILVPFFIYGAEAVLAREYMESKKNSNQDADQLDNSIHNNVQLNKSSQAIKWLDNIQLKISSDESRLLDKSGSLDKFSQDKIQLDKKNIQSKTSSQDNVQLDKSSQSAKPIQPDMSSENNIQLDKADENIQPEKSSEENIQPEKSSEENIQLDKSSGENVQPDKSSENIQQKVSSEENVQSDKSSDTIQLDNKSGHSKVVKLEKRSRRKRSKEETEKEIARVTKIALDIIKETGQLGRPTLMAKAACNEYIAKQVMKEEIVIKELEKMKKTS